MRAAEVASDKHDAQRLMPETERPLISERHTADGALNGTALGVVLTSNHPPPVYFAEALRDRSRMPSVTQLATAF